MLQRFLQDTSGATAIEYAILAMLIGGIAMAPIALLGSTASETFGTIDVAVGGTGGSGEAGGSTSGTPSAGSGGGGGSGPGEGFM